jgi:arylsulfatase A-like enzyme
MQRVSSPRLRLLRTLPLAGAALLALAGCGRDEAGRDSAAPGTPVRIALADRLDAADVQPSAEHVGFLTEAGRHQLRAGWHDVSHRAKNGERWTRHPVASIDVPVTEPSPLTLVLSVTPARALLREPEDGEPQRLRILWNGEPLADEDLDWRGETLELRVPAERQRIGGNQLDLMPSYWLRPRAHRLGWDDRMLGVRLDQLEVRSEAPQVAPARPLAMRQGAAIVQQAGSVVSFGLRLPQRARLRGRLVLRGPALPQGRLRVSLRGEGGTSRLLLDRRLPEISGEGVDLVADLAAESGGFAVLDLAASLPAKARAARPPALVWQDLHIEGSGPAPAPAATRIPRGDYNVIVLLPDSLRRDHAYGSDAEASPNVRRLAERGVRFERMRSQSSWTRPAVASMFTSLAPISHGIHGLGDKLDPSLVYLPPLLKRRGYHTFAILNSPVVSLPFRFGRGYDMTYTYYELRDERRRAPDFGPASEVSYVWREFVETQLQEAGQRPFFLFLHEIDPHSPYDPPEPFASRHDTGLMAGFNISSFATLDPRQFDAGEMEYLRGLYRGEVAYVDAWLGELMDVLDETGLATRTLLVLVSDHGEEFFEHGGVGHGKTVYEEQLRVPFLMSLPGVLPEGRRIDVEAQLVDVAPTLLDLLGAEIPAAMQGRSLLPWIEGADPAALDRPVVAHAMNRKAESIQWGRWKLVRRNPMVPERGSASYALFDLERDPGELTDRWQHEPVVGAALRQLLEHEIAVRAAATGRSPKLEPEPIPPIMIEALKALGYGGEE